MPARKAKYINIPLEDVEGLLPFNMPDAKDLQDEIVTENKVRKEIGKFMDLLKKNMKENIVYMGSEKEFGKHLERFMFANGGFVEIIIEHPVTINAHFSNLTQSKKYAQGLKKTLQAVIPESSVKKLFLKSITSGKRQGQPLTYDKWQKMHHVYIRKSVILTFVAIFIVVVFEIIKAASEIVFLEWLKIGNDKLIVVIGAVIVAFLFEPIKKWTEKMVNKYLVK